MELPEQPQRKLSARAATATEQIAEESDPRRWSDRIWNGLAAL